MAHGVRRSSRDPHRTPLSSTPVSTTHVSSGAIIGIGLRDGAGRVNWRVVRDMALAWVVTLPGAGLLGLAAYLPLRLVSGGA